ncbi:MAG: threonine dehydratase [Colwellia sp.]|nr:threonine dehydratase [Colwellia sp.]MCW8863518.1 threonine dehydratase [Colwellia sp.]MCW9079952.1 threonine dehydratase [Colwellia sp.]
MFTLQQLEQASELVHQVFPATPQYAWPQLANICDCEVWVKHENHTPTSAFKVRGGLVLIDALMKSAHPPKGLISATIGNHGQSLAFAGKRAGLPVTIVVPEGNNEDQNRAIKSHGANLVIYGHDFEAARQHSLLLQHELGYRAVAPFEHELVLGVATYALELFNAVSDLDTIYVPIGMGSGIAGIIQVRDLLGLKTTIVGVVATGAPTFALSFAAGKVINTETAQTIADGVKTRSPMTEAFEIIKRGCDHIVQVTDGEIAQAMMHYYQATHNLAEGAGAISLAALIKEKEQMSGKKVAVILTGANIDYQRFSQYINAAM